LKFLLKFICNYILRGLYIRAREEKILEDLWKDLPDHFFEDCNDFEIKTKKLYWIDGSEHN